MFHHSFSFVIISSDRQTEDILRTIQPLEDCGHAFQTVSCAREASVSDKTPDTAYLFDSADIEDIPQYAECILITTGADPRLTDPAAISAISDIWIMPQQRDGRSGLLTAYFKRLIRRMKQSADARKQAICFNTLIDSVPDIAWFKETSGKHLIVNDSFCRMVGKTKDQIYKQGHCYIWDASKEDEEICLNSDRIIMESRKTNIFEEHVKTNNDIRLLKSYKSALIDVNDEIFGTCGIAHDVTELRNMSSELSLVLNSIPFAVLVENKDNIVLNKNSHFDMYFPNYTDIIGKSSIEWRQSLTKRLLLDGRLMEVVIQSDENQTVLVFEEEPIFDIFKREIGRIVTLMDITIEWGISQQNEHSANTDYLTGLNNRRHLMHHLENIYTRDDTTLIMMDLDNFKHVNDTYGHKAGDRALIRTAELLKECFPDQFVSRMGGDEFLIVLSGKASAEAKQGASRLRHMIQDEFSWQKEFREVTASVGMVSVSLIPTQQRNISDLLKIVDDLLYNAKKNGKNCCCIYGENEPVL